ncbi:MAG: type II toxin-antitoxin system RelE/ParE family toxin [Lachnospiraceae bacterium]|nr:type II toxin-antitoxin system RelE/ParE family toxin [Lachnospiraceae bacterium]
MKKCKYKIEFTFSSRDDMRKMKKYILDTFKYRELGENFTRKMKEATEGLKTLPESFDKIGLQYRGYGIRLKLYRKYLFFYVVDNKTKIVTILRVMQEGMDWQVVLKRWLKENE